MPTTSAPAGASESATHDLTALRTRLTGRVVEPHEGEYDALRTIVLGGVDPRPAAIVRPLDDADVATAVRWAQEAGLPFAVRGGGHSNAAHGTVDGGVVIDLREMTVLEVDAENRTLWAEAGLTAGEVTTALTAHGLAVGFGDTGSVGIAGITLGGGVGYLSRLHGLTVDNLLAADVVTADGRVLRADAETHPDLFWAIRGGGGNLGVVTRLQYRAHPVDQVVGGMIFWPATAETVAGLVAAAEAAPEEVSGILNVMPCPPMPFVAEEHHGRLVVIGLLCAVGPAEEGTAALAPFRAVAEPLVDMVGPKPYAELFPPEDPDYHPTAVARTMFVDRFDVELARRLVERLEAADGMRVTQLRVLGGAIARVPSDATAYAHRGSHIMANVATFYDGPMDLERRREWVEGTGAVLQQEDTGAYVNFLADEGPERVRAAYPGATWDRLAEVKAAYDPRNVFRRNQNVPPAGA